MSGLNVSKGLQQQYKGYYQADISEWRRLSAVDKATNIERLCRGIPHDPVLEIGAGEGALLERLSALGFATRFQAVEISPSGVEAMRSRNIPGLEDCRLFDGYTLPQPDGVFNLAILSHVLEHVEHPRRLLNEAGRVASHVFVEVPLEDTIFLPADYRPGGAGHINFFSPITIRRLIQTCDYEIVQQIVTNPSRVIYRYRYGSKGLPKYWIKELGLRLLPRMATRIWSYHSALLCKKKG